MPSAQNLLKVSDASTRDLADITVINLEPTIRSPRTKTCCVVPIPRICEMKRAHACESQAHVRVTLPKMLDDPRELVSKPRRISIHGLLLKLGQVQQVFVTRDVRINFGPALTHAFT